MARTCHWRSAYAAVLLGGVFRNDFGCLINTSRPYSHFSVTYFVSLPKNFDAMHISLDNITFYSHPPPAKSPPRAFSVSRWKPYKAPLAPQALSHTPLPRLPSPRTTTTLASDAASARLWGPARPDLALRPARNEFDIEIERMARAESEQATHEADLDMHPDSGPRNGNVTDMDQTQRTSSATGISNCSSKRSW